MMITMRHGIHLPGERFADNASSYKKGSGDDRMDAPFDYANKSKIAKGN